MTYADRIYRWNRMYDGAPAEWRFQILFWFIIAVGAINMTLTIADGFPFGLLVLLAVIWIATIRVPYALGWVKAETADAHEDFTARMEIEPAAWVYRLNVWYDSIHEFDRPYYMLGALIVVGAINMALTIAHAFTFGLLFLIALLAVITIRGPYVAGWYKQPAHAMAPLALPPHAPRISSPMTLAPEPAEAHSEPVSEPAHEKPPEH